jgi:2-dehydropantoate 2-reductase
MEETQSRNLNKRKIAIVGAGAIGCWFAAHLVRAGHEVRLYGRSTVGELQQKGIQVCCAGGDFEVGPLPAFAASEDSGGPAELVIIALKTTAREALKSLLPPLVGPQTLVLTLQNGLGNVEFLSQLMPPERIMAGLCFIAVVRESSTRIRNFIADGGRTIIGENQGPATPRLEAIAGLLREAGLQCRTDDNLQSALWHKLVWNIPFNGLTIAAGGVTTDRVCSSPRLRAAALTLMKEIRAAASAQGIDIAPEFLEKQFPFTEKMGPYKPSSLVDFLEKRPVEVESIFAEPLRQGQDKEVPMPCLELLHGILQSVCSPG